MTERDFHDDSSSFDEILDFEFYTLDEEGHNEERGQGEVAYYRSLDEY